MSGAARTGLALLFALGGAAVGWLEGRAFADGRLAPTGWFAGDHSDARRAAAPPPSTTPPPRVSASLRELFSELADLELPHAVSRDPARWRDVLLDLAGLAHGHGIPTDFADDEGTLARYAELGPAADVAALLDLWSEAAQRAGNAVVRDTATRLAARLDPDPFRSRVRAALLSNEHERVRDLGVDADPADLDARSAALIGAALLRFGDEAEALQHWRAGALEHPEDPVLHLLLAWKFDGRAADDAAAREEVARQLAAACALLPEDDALRARLAAAR